MADCIKIGNLDISAVKIGSTDPIIYVGGVKVYPTAPIEYKLQATYSDSSKYNLACDSSTTLTRNEVRSGSTPYSSMTTAVIGDCVTTLYRSFSGCKSLSSVTLPNTVTNISSDTFYICSSLISVDIPSGVTSIGGGAFEGCSGLTSIDIPNSVTTIGSQAFRHCSGLTSIEIPSSVTDIGIWGFENCSSLTSVTIGSGVTSIGDSAFKYCSSLTSITINATTPPTLGGTSVFGNTNNCPIYVPCDSVDAFKAASGWSTYANRIQAIPGSCPFKLKATLSSGDTKLVECNGNTTLTNSEITGNSTPYYRYYEAEVGSCVTTIQTDSFVGAYSLSSFTMNDSVTSVGSNFLSVCNNLTNLKLSNNLQTVGDNLLSGTYSLETVELPDSVTSLGSYTMWNCTNGSTFPKKGLKHIIIGSGITSIGNYSFEEKNNSEVLQDITIKATTPPTFSSALSTYNYTRFKNTTIYVPAESVEAYKAASGWSTYASKIRAIPT